MSMGEALAMRLEDIDLTNPDTFLPGYPHEAFRTLRAEAPVYWHPERGGRGFWVVSKYDDVKGRLARGVSEVKDDLHDAVEAGKNSAQKLASRIPSDTTRSLNS